MTNETNNNNNNKKKRRKLKSSRDSSKSPVIVLSADVINHSKNRNDYSDQVDADDTNTLLLPSSINNNKKKKSTALLHQNIKKKTKKVIPTVELSKRKQRKIKSLQIRKKKESERGELMETIENNKVDDEHLKLLKSSKLIGVGTETTKQLVERVALHDRILSSSSVGTALEPSSTTTTTTATTTLASSSSSATTTTIQMMNKNERDRLSKYWGNRAQWKDRWNESSEQLLYGNTSSHMMDDNNDINDDNNDNDDTNDEDKNHEEQRVPPSSSSTTVATKTDNSKVNDTPKKKSSTPFITLDFFGQSSSTTTTHTSNKNDQQQNSKKRRRVAFDLSNKNDRDDDDDSDNEEHEEESMENEEEESDPINGQMAGDKNDDQEEEDGEPLSFNEQVCKKFSSLIDTVEKHVSNSEAKSILLAEIYHLLDFVVPDDENDSEDDDDESDGDENSEEEEDYEESNRQYALSLRDTLRHSLEGMSADQYSTESIDSIQSILKEIDDGRTEDQKRIRYTKFFIPVHRQPQIEHVRHQLPVVCEESNIMETITDNDIVILCGETGSGKTTQVPQFLYEAGYGHEQSGHPGFIAVTQPRRVAALSTAKRVAEELNIEFGTVVSYHVRYDNNLSEQTLIKFMTDGILLKEIQNDSLLLKYSVIVLDEAHERNVNTDILIGWLSRFIPQRNKMAREGVVTPLGVKITPLKLIIMSATLRVDDFVKNKRLFTSPHLALEHNQSHADDDDEDDDDKKNVDGALAVAPPVINITSRQFPVTVHFNKRTVFDDYVDACYRKVVTIHEKLPNGAILVFLTGKSEIDFLVSKLQEYAMKQKRKREKLLKQQQQEGKGNAEEEEEDDDEEMIDDEDLINNMGDLDDEDEEEGDAKADKKKEQTSVDADDENAAIVTDEKTGALVTNDTKSSFNEQRELEEKLLEANNEENIDRVLFSDNIKDQSVLQSGINHNKKLRKKKAEPLELYALPLYSLLQPNEQLKVFEPPPPGCRLVVIATNVAETSLTIPGVRYVVDSGRVKDKEYDKVTGVSKFVIKWTSKASSDQRAGRAGRTGPGHCYRLYSSALYDNTFKQFTDPDILLTPIDTVILQMKNMGIQNVENFPFPTPPDEQSLKSAVNSLVNIQALDKSESRPITALGRAMNEFPLNPRYAKMLILSRKQSVQGYISAIVSALTVSQLFMFDSHLNHFRQRVEQEKRKRSQVLAAKKKRRAIGLDTASDDEEKEEDDEEEEWDDEEAINQMNEEDVLSAQELKMRESCGKAKQMWSHPTSDLLSLLRAVGAYRLSPNPTQFCHQWFLHTKNMKEVSSLMRQLQRIIDEHDQGNSEMSDEDEEEEDCLLRPPTEEDELVIRQIICAGLVDRVARLATEEEWPGLDASFTSKNRPYISIQLGAKTPVFIHPSSYLFGKYPEYVVYNDISKSKGGKIYIKGITAIQPNWLSEFAKPMVKLSKPLDVPAPRFSSKDDAMYAFVHASYADASSSVAQQQGNNVWQLPIQQIEITVGQYGSNFVFGTFARLLIEGKVFKDLRVFKDKLESSGMEVEKMNSEKAIQFVNAIRSLFGNDNSVSKQRLIQRWQKEPTFLRDEYVRFVKKRFKTTVQDMWPPKQ